MSLAAEAANLGMWVWDGVKDEVWMPEKGRALFGLAPDVRLDYAGLAARVHPEDRAAREAARNGGANFRFEEAGYLDPIRRIPSGG